MTHYHNDWKEEGYDAMRRDFSIPDDAEFPPDSAILYADYTYESYSGSAFVLYEQDGKLYEVNGSHCSCYGLEGQWEPEETTWAAIAMRPYLADEIRLLADEHLAASDARGGPVP